MSAFRKGAFISATLATMLGVPAYAQEAPKTPIEAPAEPNAIPLETGGVEGQTAKESWYKQWGDPFVRNVSRATLTPFLPDPAKAWCRGDRRAGRWLSNPLDGQRRLGSGAGPQ